MTAGLEGAVGFAVGFVLGLVLYRWKGKKTEALLTKELGKAMQEADELRAKLHRSK